MMRMQMSTQLNYMEYQVADIRSLLDELIASKKTTSETIQVTPKKEGDAPAPKADAPKAPAAAAAPASAAAAPAPAAAAPAPKAPAMVATATADENQPKINVLVNGQPVQAGAITSNAQADTESTTESTTETEKESESKN
jgi:hypothetical protein